MKLKKKVKSLGIIIDGNRRWAVKKGLKKTDGHKYGLDNLLSTIEWARELGIEEVTFYIFSTENWKRKKIEVAALMTLFEKVIKDKLSVLADNGFEIKFIGDVKMFSKKLQKLIFELEKKSKVENGEKKVKVFLAASYGGRNEIINGIKKLSRELTKKEIEKIDEVKFEKFLYSGVISDPEIIIRTGGDTRLSNFLMWKSTYSELIFLKKLWPDFRKKDLEKILKKYQEARLQKGK